MLTKLIYRTFTPSKQSTLRTLFAFAQDNKANQYIPLRPLQPHSVLFTSAPYKIPLILRTLAFTPFFAFSLQGFLNEWTTITGAATFISFFFGVRIISFINFYRSHQVYQLAVNKDLTKFELSLTSNFFTKKYEQALLGKETMGEKLKRQVEKGISSISNVNEITKEYTKSEWEAAAQGLAASRSIITVDLQSSQIEKMEKVSYKALKKLIKERMKLQVGNRKKGTDVLQDYNTDKQVKNYLLIKTKVIGVNQPLVFFLEMQANQDKKYEEYLKAFGEGKKILQV